MLHAHSYCTKIKIMILTFMIDERTLASEQNIIMTQKAK